MNSSALSFGGAGRSIHLPECSSIHSSAYKTHDEQVRLAISKRTAHAVRCGNGICTGMAEERRAEHSGAEPSA